MKKQLKDICAGFVRNIALKDLSANNGEYPIYGASGYIKGIDYYVSDKPYIGIVKDGSGVGRVNSYPAYSSLLGTMQYIAPNEDINLNFLMYALRALRLEKFCSGAAIPHIYFRDYQKLYIDVPEESEQKRIADELDGIEKAIATKEKQIAELDELVKSKFIEMFGDPVENPYHWGTKSLLDLGDCKNGLNFGANERGVTVRNLGVGAFGNLSTITDVSILKTVSLNEMPKEEMLLKDGDIVFVRSNGNKNLVGRCLSIYPKGEPTTFSGFCIRFRKASESVLTEYLVQVLKMDGMRSQMAGRGAGIQNLNQQILRSLQIPLPPMENQNEYVSFVEKANRAKETAEKQIADLQELLEKKMDEYFN